KEPDNPTDRTEELLSLTADLDDDDLRYSAVVALGEMGEKCARREVVEGLMNLASEEDTRFRYAAIWALGGLGATAGEHALQQLFAATQDQDRHVRMAGVQSIGELREMAATSDVRNRLLLLINDSDPGMRSASVWAVGETIKDST